MKALSLRQPWAWAVICAGKRIENRVWPSLKRGFVDDMSNGIKRGEYIAIHASATRPKDYDWDGVELAIGRRLTHEEQGLIDDQRGHIIGVAQVCGILRTDAQMTVVEDGNFPHYVMRPEDYKLFVGDRGTERHKQQLDQLKRWWLGPYAFWLTDVQALTMRLPAKGALNFWQVAEPAREHIITNLCPPTIYEAAP